MIWPESVRTEEGKNAVEIRRHSKCVVAWVGQMAKQTTHKEVIGWMVQKETETNAGTRMGLRV